MIPMVICIQPYIYIKFYTYKPFYIFENHGLPLYNNIVFPYMRSYIGIQNGRRMFDFVQRYLREVNTWIITFGHGTVCGVWSSGCHGISPFKRLAAFVFITQLDGIFDGFTFCNTGKYYRYY